jgi:Rrf2 family iron-sulfur cluster assembly transcriptional regulator
MLGQAAGYATAALGYLATAGGKPMLVKEIADACAIPAPYLGKIVNTLRRVGLVQTQRGVGGGVTLARRAQDISLYAIAELLGDPICNRRCMLGTAECSDERACPAHKFWVEHRGSTLDFLRTTSVADIAVFETRRRTRALQPSERVAAVRIQGRPMEKRTDARGGKNPGFGTPSRL